MKPEAILKSLKEGANFSIDTGGHGSISHCPECVWMDQTAYNLHYCKCKSILESLPWTKVVENPRNPKSNEYPQKDGEYITMLDVNEHQVQLNTFNDGHWLFYDRTHIKWWMPVPIEC